MSHNHEGAASHASQIIWLEQRIKELEAKLQAYEDAPVVAWRYENRNVKGNWYITWTEPDDRFNKRPLYEKPSIGKPEVK